jgi:3-oxoacyl-[acyl-carrier-protein] synthase III
MANNYIKVIRKALKSAGIKINDISRFLINQNSVSIVNKVITQLNIPATKLFSIRKHYGHIGAVDTLFSLEQCINKNIVKKNDIVILASTGIGYHWGAQVIRI